MLPFMGQPLVPHSEYRQRQAKLFNYVKTQGKVVITEKYTLPDGSTMEDKGVMTRKKETAEK